MSNTQSVMTPGKVGPLHRRSICLCTKVLPGRNIIVPGTPSEAPAGGLQPRGIVRVTPRTCQGTLCRVDVGHAGRKGTRDDCRG